MLIAGGEGGVGGVAGVLAAPKTIVESVANEITAVKRANFIFLIIKFQIQH